jgi:hypothetical protein
VLGCPYTQEEQAVSYLYAPQADRWVAFELSELTRTCLRGAHGSSGRIVAAGGVPGIGSTISGRAAKGARSSLLCGHTQVSVRPWTVLGYRRGMTADSAPWCDDRSCLARAALAVSGIRLKPLILKPSRCPHRRHEGQQEWRISDGGGA